MAHAGARVLPPDPAQLDPQVRAAVAELTGIVARRDLAALKRHLPADAKISFGGDTGPEGLDIVWEPTRPDTKLWDTLRDILALGGLQAKHDDAWEWCAPYPSCHDAPVDSRLTGYDYVIVTGTAVAVRSAPSTSAALLGRVSHEVLELAAGDQADWWQVKWHGGTGHVRHDLARSPVDYRLTLRIAQGDWFIPYFLGGD